MTVYESSAGVRCPITPLGNGKMLAYLSGASIHSLHCGYSTPSFLSLFPDTAGGYYESESERQTLKGSFVHRLRYRAGHLRTDQLPHDQQSCDQVVTDYIAKGEGLLLRTTEGSAPFRWRISLPGYVRGAAVCDYRLIHCEAEALFCTISVGTPFESGLVLREEASLTLYLCGDLHFEEEGRVIRFDGGRGYILFVDSRQPTASLKRADQILTQLQKGVLPAELPCFREETVQEMRTFPAIDEIPPARLSARLNDAIGALRSMQSEKGVFLSDIWHPYAMASDLPILTEALLKLGYVEEASKMIACWSAQLGKNREGIPPMLDGSGEPIRFGEVCDGASTAAFLLAAVMLIETEAFRSDVDSAEALYRKLRKAFTLMMHALVDGMIPFSGCEGYFEAGMLDRDCMFHGSAPATAIAITAAERYIAYCSSTGRKIARESERYLAALADAREKFEGHFGRDGLYRLSAPELEENTHRPRFLRGICPSCSREAAFPAVELLELSRNGYYRCKRCFASPHPDEPRHTERQGDLCIPLIDATATVAHWMSSPFRENALDRAAALYRASAEQNRTLPLRLGATDAMLLAASRERSGKDQALFRRVLIQSASLDEDPRIELCALPSALVDANEMKGADCSSAAIAAQIVALA